MLHLRYFRRAEERSIKRGYLSLLFIALLFLAGCVGARDVYRENPVGVETLTLGEVQESPRRITATLKGYTGVCERLETRQRLEGKTFYVSVVGIYQGPADAACPAIAQEYTRTVTLKLEDLAAGVYTVVAGSLSRDFMLLSGERTPYEANIVSVDVLLLESYPVQVVVTAEGYLTNGCDELGDVTQRRDEATFFVTILGLAPVLPNGVACTPAGDTFSERVTLATRDLAPGTYKVNVNGVVESFTLP